MSDGALFDSAAMTNPALKNPCVLVFGRGPEGATCKKCVHLIVRQMGRRYYKCGHRRISSSPATDHRVGWAACGKYEEAEA